ncbi:hypothetical protein GIB67_021061 [Kingdonia uniflora]|uniref:Uncharacterized protein n=1 Tax=Kingdonia uniflora TaxID=39325 RepID=A0A7J7N786_9MAGN|nr:hypothetical protein GIB67_021061 [Kingdonia uniflora]
MKVEDVEVPLKKKVEGTQENAFTDIQLDHVPLIFLKTLIPKILKKGLEGLEVVKDLMVDDKVEVEREVNLEAISPEYGSDRLEEEDIDEANLVTYHLFAAIIEQITVVSIEEQTMDVAEVVKTKVVFSYQEKDVDEANQTSVDQTTSLSVEEHSEEEVVEGKDDCDGTSQKKDEKNQIGKIWSLRKDEFSLKAKDYNTSTYRRIGEETVCLNAFYILHPNQWLDNEVINVYINALIQYFDSQHRVRLAKEMIVLMDVYFSQIIDKAFSIWTQIMPSPEGVELMKNSIWEQITSMRWDYIVSRCFD